MKDAVKEGDTQVTEREILPAEDILIFPDDTLTAKDVTPPAEKEDTSEVKEPELIDGKYKTVEEVIEARRQAERKIGEMSAELGTYRKLFDQTAQAQATASPAKKTIFEDPDLTDKILTNPREVLEQVKEAATRDAAVQVAQEMARMQAVNELHAQYPNFRETVQSQEFNEWLVANIPPQIVQIANNDPVVYKHILDNYSMKKVTSEAVTKAREEATSRKTLTEHATVPHTSSKSRDDSAPVFYRHQLAKMMMEEPEKYAALQPQIMKAYQEGRVK